MFHRTVKYGTAGNMKFYAVLLVVVLTYISGTEGCSCVRSDPQSKYCQSTFALIGKINGRTIQDSEKIYNVDVTHVYKGNASTGSAEIKTALYDSMCGVELDDDKVYLLNGFESNGEMRIELCDFISSYPLNDPDNVFPLDTYFDCRCRVLNIQPLPDKPIPKNTCPTGGRFRCPADSGSLGDMAECRYSEESNNCVWKC